LGESSITALENPALQTNAGSSRVDRLITNQERSARGRQSTRTYGLRDQVPRSIKG